MVEVMQPEGNLDLASQSTGRGGLQNCKDPLPMIGALSGAWGWHGQPEDRCRCWTDG